MRFVLLAGLLVAGVARADQCAYVSERVATRALEHLSAGTYFIPWCEPCGEREPGRERSVKTAEVREVEGTPYREVVVNGEAVDLAYVFVRIRRYALAYTNLAKRVGCRARDVSPSIPVEIIPR